jgi:hypothetical protein
MSVASARILVDHVLSYHEGPCHHPGYVAHARVGGVPYVKRAGPREEWRHLAEDAHGSWPITCSGCRGEGPDASLESCTFFYSKWANSSERFSNPPGGLSGKAVPGDSIIRLPAHSGAHYTGAQQSSEAPPGFWRWPYTPKPILRKVVSVPGASGPGNLCRVPSLEGFASESLGDRGRNRAPVVGASRVRVCDPVCDPSRGARSGAISAGSAERMADFPWPHAAQIGRVLYWYAFAASSSARRM